MACVLLASSVGMRALAQGSGSHESADAGPTVSAPILAPDQLDSLVAPVALYPDQLLSQVLAASTYPLELAEAQQWLQHNGNLRGPQLVEAAKEEKWDPSIQALVLFPDAMALLSRDVHWTTSLGNAFLAQEADVMDSIQRLRVRAQNQGKLLSTPQETVTTQEQDGQSAIEIQPADPQTVYVPSYNPQAVWGSPAQGEYPQLGYPSPRVNGDYPRGAYQAPPEASAYPPGRYPEYQDYPQPAYQPAPEEGNYPQRGYQGSPAEGDYQQGGYQSPSAYQVFGAAVNLGSYLAGFGGLLAGGWGWGFNWLAHSLVLNGLFFNNYGFRGGYADGGGYAVQSAWVHDPGHREGVPYSNGVVASRLGGEYRPDGLGARGRSVSSHDDGSHGTFGGGWRTPGGGRAGDQRTYGQGDAGRSKGPNQGRGGERGFSYSNRGGEEGWHTASNGRSSDRSSFGSSAGLEFSSSGYGRAERRGDGYAAGGSNRYSAGAMGYRGPADGFGRAGGSGYRGGFSADAGRDSRSRYSFAAPDRSFSHNGSSYGAPSQHFWNSHSSERSSAPHGSSQHFSTPHNSKFSFSGGHGSGGHTPKGHGSSGHSHKH